MNRDTLMALDPERQAEYARLVMEERLWTWEWEQAGRDFTNSAHFLARQLMNGYKLAVLDWEIGKLQGFYEKKQRLAKTMTEAEEQLDLFEQTVDAEVADREADAELDRM